MSMPKGDKEILRECLEHAAAKLSVQAATLRFEAKVQNASANIAHAEECDAWVAGFRSVLAATK